MAASFASVAPGRRMRIFNDVVEMLVDAIQTLPGCALGIHDFLQIARRRRCRKRQIEFARQELREPRIERLIIVPKSDRSRPDERDHLLS